LVVEMALSGDLLPRLSADGSAIEFVTADGVTVLRYGDLHAYDASGKELRAWMELGATCDVRSANVGGANACDVLRLVVDVTGAIFPITIDPLATSPSWTAEGSQAGARYGYSVATAGDVYGDGYSDVIVGAPYYDTSLADAGKVFVFYGSASGLSTSANWTADGDLGGARFGHVVATAGDVNDDGYSDVIIGAPYYGNGQNNEGKVFVYTGTVSGLSTSADWSVESNQTGSVLGYAVGTAGDVNGDGYSDVVVGAPYFDNGQVDEGKVFVYTGTVSGLSASADWSVEGGIDEANLGFAVGTAGSVNGDEYSDVIVGAPYYYNMLPGEGRAYVYHGGSGGLNTSYNWMEEGAQLGANFGWSVSTAGDVNGDGYSDVIVGVQKYTDSMPDEGAARVYHGSASGLSPAPNWSESGSQNNAKYGSAVATAGDVNGDGYGDVIVGAYTYDDDGKTDVGRATVYHGGPAGLGAAAALTMAGIQGQDYAHFGQSVATAGDVNGDGFSDVIAGAPN
jgi:hypothetical protein